MRTMQQIWAPWTRMRRVRAYHQPRRLIHCNEAQASRSQPCLTCGTIRRLSEETVTSSLGLTLRIPQVQQHRSPFQNYQIQNCLRAFGGKLKFSVKSKLSIGRARLSRLGQPMTQA